MKKQKSSSSGKMEKLNNWQDVVELGKRISSELGAEWEHDLLSKWISQRIAELMDQGENEKNKSKREKARASCSDLIFRLMEIKKLSELSKHLDRLAMSFSSNNPFFSITKKNAEKLSGEFESKLSSLKDITNQEDKVSDVGILASLPEKLTVSDKKREETKDILDKFNNLIKIRKSKIESLSGILDKDKITSKSKKNRQKAVKEALTKLLNEKAKIIRKL